MRLHVEVLSQAVERDLLDETATKIRNEKV